MYINGKRKSALAAMVALAKNYGNGPLHVQKLSNEEGTSISYLEQLFCYLRRANLVRGVRGPGGGYVLTRSPDKISVAEILDSFDMPDERIPSLAKLEAEYKSVLQRFTLDRLIS